MPAPEQEHGKNIRVPKGCLYGLIPVSMITGMLSGAGLREYVGIEKMQDYPQIGDEGVPIVEVPEGLNADELEFWIADETSPVLNYSREEVEKAESEDTLWQVSELEEAYVKKYFHTVPQESEFWFVATFASLYPEDGGPDRIGKSITNDYAIMLTEKGIKSLSDFYKKVKGYSRENEKLQGHTRDSEELRVFGRIVDGKMEIKGIETNEHGTWVFDPAEELTYIDGHPVLSVSISTDTKYPSVKACNEATSKRWGIKWLRDKCSKAGFLYKPSILWGRNVGERDDQKYPFETDRELREKYPEQETWDKSGRIAFCDPNETEECEAWLEWWPPGT